MRITAKPTCFFLAEKVLVQGKASWLIYNKKIFVIIIFLRFSKKCFIQSNKLLSYVSSSGYMHDKLMYFCQLLLFLQLLDVIIKLLYNETILYLKDVPPCQKIQFHLSIKPLCSIYSLTLLFFKRVFK